MLDQLERATVSVVAALDGADLEAPGLLPSWSRLTIALVPRDDESGADVVRSLRQRSAELDDDWRIVDDWSTRVVEPPDNADLGPAPLPVQDRKRSWGQMSVQVPRRPRQIMIGWPCTSLSTPSPLSTWSTTSHVSNHGSSRPPGEKRTATTVAASLVGWRK